MAGPAEHRWIGASLRRFEDRRLITGTGRYVDDVKLAGALTVAFLRSPHAHARIRSIDATAARRAPGVADVVVGADVVGLGHIDVEPLVPNIRAVEYPLLARDRVRYVGECVAAVAAESPALARDAVDLIEVEYEPLPSVSDAEAALAPGAPVLHEELGDNVACSAAYGSSAEEVESVFRSADHVVSLRLESPRVTAVPLEPRAIAVEYVAADDSLRVHASTQRTFGPATHARMSLGLDPDRVHAIVGDVGGAFGAKGHPYREEVLVIYLADRLKRAVRWTATRSEEFLGMMGGRDQVAYGEAAFDRAGTLLAVRARVVGNLGAYLFGNTVLSPLRAGRLVTGAYRVGVARAELLCAYTNRMLQGPYRGAGRPEGAYIIERLMDTAARELGIDPVEIRRRNFIRSDEFPYRTPLDQTYDSGDYARALDQVLALSDYPSLVARRAAARARGELYGVGIATFVEPAGGGAGFESGRVRVEPDGAVVLESGSMSQGQGHQTAFAQIVADVLRIPPETVTVVQGDSRRVPVGIGTFGSRSTIWGGGAAHVAASKVLEKMTAVAAHLLEVRPEDVIWDGDTFRPAGVPARGRTFREVAAAAHDPGQLPPGLEPGLVWDERFTGAGETWPHGAHIAAVSIDRDTGRVTTEGYWAVDDAGVVINPLLADAQVVGGLAQGFGQALSEAMLYDDQATLLSGTLSDYAAPRASDLPRFVVGETVTPAPGNPLGVKGLGESGTVGAPSTLANAVADALAAAGHPSGHVSMPMTSEKLWRALHHPTSTSRRGA